MFHVKDHYATIDAITAVI